MKTSIKDSTWLLYENLIRNHINPVLGGFKLKQLKAMDIQRLLNEKMESGRLDGKEGGLSASTLKHIHKIFRGSLEQALAEKLIAVNPALAVKAPKQSRQEVKILSKEQVEIFLSFVQKDAHYKRYYPAYLLELSTGCRRGELLGMRFQDIDLEAGRVKLVQQLVKVGSQNKIRELKTGSSQNRIIVLPEKTVQVLREYKRQKREEYEDVGFSENEVQELMTEGLVFTTALGKPIQPRNFTRSFKLALKAAGLPDRSFHSMRHFFAIWSLQSGVDIKTLQSDLGHDEVTTTLDRYAAHVNEEMKQEAARKRGQFFETKL